MRVEQALRLLPNLEALMPLRGLLLSSARPDERVQFRETLRGEMELGRPERSDRRRLLVFLSGFTGVFGPRSKTSQVTSPIFRYPPRAARRAAAGRDVARGAWAGEGVGG